jgi:hypothetical protein
MLVKKEIEPEQKSVAADQIENLWLQLSVLKEDNDDLKMERNLYKKLFEEEIKLQYCRVDKKIKPSSKK